MRRTRLVPSVCIAVLAVAASACGDTRVAGVAPKACPNTPYETDSEPWGEAALVVWEGHPPLSKKQANRTSEMLYRRYIYPGPRRRPSPAIRKYVAALLARWPDLSELPDECVDLSPWPRSPLIRDASGPVFYFEIVLRPTAGAQAWKCALATAREQGLVVFDPDANRIRVRP